MPFLDLSKTTFYRKMSIWPFYQLGACSHEPGTVNYPGVMISPGQVLPRVHMMICCPGATLRRVNCIAPGQVQGHLITTKLSESFSFAQIVIENELLTRLPISGAFWNFLLENLFQTLIMSMRKTTRVLGQLLRSVHMEKSYLGKAGYLVLYNG